MTKRLLTLKEVADGALPHIDDTDGEYDITAPETAQMKAMVDEAEAELAADPASAISIGRFKAEMRDLRARFFAIEADRKR